MFVGQRDSSRIAIDAALPPKKASVAHDRGLHDAGKVNAPRRIFRRGNFSKRDVQGKNRGCHGRERLQTYVTGRPRTGVTFQFAWYQSQFRCLHVSTQKFGNVLGRVGGRPLPVMQDFWSLLFR